MALRFENFPPFDTLYLFKWREHDIVVRPMATLYSKDLHCTKTKAHCKYNFINFSWRHSLLSCWNTTMVPVTSHEHRCTTQFQYSLEKITLISPKISLGTKMAHYKTHFLLTSGDRFIIRPPYMDIHLSYALRSVIGQLQTSSHQLELEVGRYIWIPLEERICQLCH